MILGLAGALSDQSGKAGNISEMKQNDELSFIRYLMSSFSFLFCFLTQVGNVNSSAIVLVFLFC